MAALLFFIEHHSGKEKLPTDTSKTSKPMTWNQPPKIEITPACAKEMTFVKPSHTDLKDTCEHKSVRHSEFDPIIPAHRTLEKDAVMNLVAGIHASVSNTGLKQFWESNSAPKTTTSQVINTSQLVQMTFLHLISSDLPNNIYMLGVHYLFPIVSVVEGAYFLCVRNP